MFYFYDCDYKTYADIVKNESILHNFLDYLLALEETESRSQINDTILDIQSHYDLDMRSVFPRNTGLPNLTIE